MKERQEDRGLDDDGSAFDKLLGAFGSHANVEKRRRAERLAAMKPTDGRRKKSTRPHQFNVRISDKTQVLATALCEAKKWSQADLVEAAIAALARAEKIGATDDA